MNPTIALGTFLLLAPFVLTGCIPSSEKHAANIRLGVSQIPVHDVPKTILTAAENHVPGIYIHEARINHHRTHDIYELRGLSHHSHYEIYVSGDGRILDIDHDKWLSD